MGALETIREKADDWMHTWAALTFTPTAVFKSSEHASGLLLPDATNERREAPAMQGAEFFWGAQLVAFVAAAACSTTYFAVLYADTLRSRVNQVTTGFAAVSTVVAFTILIRLLALWAIAGVTFAAYRLISPRSSFRSHLRALYYMANLDAVLGVLVTLLVLRGVPGSATWDAYRTFLYSERLPRTVAALLLCICVYYGWLAFRAMQSVHPLRGARSYMTFAFVFLPVHIAGSAASMVLGYYLLGITMVKYFD